MISIKTYGYLSRYLEKEEEEYYDFANGISVEDVLEKLQVPLSAVGFVSVNGSMVGMNYLISRGDEIKIFPVVMGG